ncbi:MAG: DDE-type integrase/transposase/recombinase [Gammaproteobacteria bacterium]
MSAQEEFEQIRLQFVDPIQHDYEVIRPIVLFAETAAERSRQTGVERTVVGDKARRFVLKGMLGLTDGRAEGAGRKGHVYPEAIAGYIVYLKQLYPPIHLREIERILQRKFGYKTNHHTLKRFLEPYDAPIQLELDLTTFSAFADAYQARWTVVRMASEGWNKKSIADGLKLSRAHVYTILETFERDGFAGLEEQRTRPPQHPDNQLSLPFFKTVLDLQHEYPRAGRFRIHGLLGQQREAPPPSERTVGRAMAINRQFHGAPGPWKSARDDQPDEISFKHLPYRPEYRHHLWFTDIRYLVQLDGSWVYSICIIEGYSRKILAGMVSPHQDLTAILQILFAALSEYGCPQAVVSDNGSVFRAGDYLAILRDLEIEPLHIEKGKPWQNLIEAQFKVQLRLADFKFEQARTLQDVQNQHATFIETFNTTPHWAHRHRADGHRTPVEVLGWLKGRVVEPERLRQLFGRTEFLRTVNRYGFVSVQRFYLYAENGLSRQRVSIWIYEGQLSIEYQKMLLARYRCDYDPKQGQLQEVSEPTLYTTPFTSPQFELIELDDEQWLKFLRRPSRPYTRRTAMLPQQLFLIDLGTSALILLALQAI